MYFFKLFLQIANIRNINIPALPANVLACPYPNKTPLSADVKAIDPFFNTPTKDNKTTDINTTNLIEKSFSRYHLYSISMQVQLIIYSQTYLYFRL